MRIIQIITTLLNFRLFLHIDILLSFEHADKLQLPLLYLLFVEDILLYVAMHINNNIVDYQAGTLPDRNRQSRNF